jgi:predicted RNA-binding Zn-ribbon protein involved in translation (DUF1610 family)
VLATVATFIDPTDAHILRARLEAEDIPACVVNEHHVRLNWFQAMALGGARVQVAAENVEEARQVMAAIERGEFALPDEPADVLACPRCGSHDIAADGRSRGVALWSLYLFALPLPFSLRRVRCRACGLRGETFRPPAGTPA